MRWEYKKMDKEIERSSFEVKEKENEDEHKKGPERWF